MKQKKCIALVAHDNKKADLIDWVKHNWSNLVPHDMVCTGTTGKLIEEALIEKLKETGVSTPPLNITKLKSGPLGGDQQLGAMIAEGKVDIFIFFWDTMSAQPHDVDVKALLRISTLYNLPTAPNRSTADFLITSRLFNDSYQPISNDFSGYMSRKIP